MESSPARSEVHVAGSDYGEEEEDEDMAPMGKTNPLRRTDEK